MRSCSLVSNTQRQRRIQIIAHALLLVCHLGSILRLYFFAREQITVLLGSVPSPAYAGRIKPSAIHMAWLASSDTSATHGSCVIQTQRTLSTTCPSKHGRLTCDLVARLLCTSASCNVHDNAQSALPTNMLTNDTLDSQTHAGTMEGRC